MENFKIYSNPLFDDEEIISLNIDPHYFNAESNLIESLLNRDILIDSSPKFDYLLEEFFGELAHIDPIPPRIEKADFDLEEEIRFVENLLYDNSSLRPPKDLNLEIADTILESLSPSPIPVADILSSTKVSTGRVAVLDDDEELNHEDASDTGNAPKQQQQMIPQTTAISNIKLPILKKEEYDIWAMEMEHYLEYIDNEVWKVIQNGNSKKRISTRKDGIVRVLSPVNCQHMRRFHGMDDAKEIWEAIRTRFGGNANSKKMQKAVFKQQFEAFKISNSEGLEKGYEQISTIDTLSIDDLYNNLRVFEQEIQGASKTSSSAQNVAFVSQIKSSTNKVKSGFTGAYSTCTPSTSSTNIPEKEVLAGLADEQIAMIAIRMKKFYKKTGRRVRVDGKTPVGFDKKKAECSIVTTLVTLLGNVQQRGHMMERRRETHFINIKKLGSKRRIRWVCDNSKKGLQVKQNKGGIFISQDKYVAEILKKFALVNVKAAITPMETKLPLTKDEEAFDVDVHLYRSMIGSLMYLTASRPDIMYAVCVCSRFQVTPKTSHLNAVKRIFKYLKGKPNLGLWYPRESPFDLEAFSDSDYGGSNLDRKSTTGGCQFLGQRLISWQCKKQTIVATSTTEAEYVAAANCCGQVLWVQNQLLDYGFNFMNTKIHIDNESTICIVKNPVYHSKTKHIEIRHHFIRDCYEKKLISVEKIHTDLNVADLLTKPFDGPRFNYLVVNIGIAWMKGRNAKYCDKHNQVGFLRKPEESAGFAEIVDFLRGSNLSDGWDQFGSNIATALVCLSTGQAHDAVAPSQLSSSTPTVPSTSSPLAVTAPTPIPITTPPPIPTPTTTPPPIPSPTPPPIPSPTPPPIPLPTQIPDI
ncbi:hypothetical protein Tco_0163619 [Tanacetum coccineum]